MAEASEIVKGVGGAASGIAGMTGVGSWLAPIIGLGTNLVGGMLEKGEAAKQAAQAQKVRQQALKTKAQAIQPEYLQKLRMDNMAALSGIPGLDIQKQALEAQNANTSRAIRESSPNGAATLAAMAAAKGLENQSLNDLMAKNEAFKANALKEVGETVKGIGAEKQSLQDKADVVKMKGLQAASALDAASTYNKQNAINKMLGAATSTVGALTKNIGGENDDAALKKLLQGYLMKQKTGATDVAVDANNVWNYQPNITPDYTTAPTTG